MQHTARDTLQTFRLAALLLAGAVFAIHLMLMPQDCTTPAPPPPALVWSLRIDNNNAYYDAQIKSWCADAQVLIEHSPSTRKQAQDVLRQLGHTATYHVDAPRGEGERNSIAGFYFKDNRPDYVCIQITYGSSRFSGDESFVLTLADQANGHVATHRLGLLMP